MHNEGMNRHDAALHTQLGNAKDATIMLQSSPRVRRRSEQDAVDAALPQVYRLGFSCQHTGRYFRSSKRCIRWSFGFTNVANLRLGKRACDCRGEEHEIELVWSVKSGKIRIYWNKRDISHYFREGNRFGTVEIGWQSQSGETLQVVAYSEARSDVPHQYDLLIDGSSFFALPALGTLGADTGFAQDDGLLDESGFEVQENRSPDNAGDSRERISSYHMSVVSELGFGSSVDEIEEEPADTIDYRLLNTSMSKDCVIVDELHSVLYTPMLEMLRSELTTHLPQTDEMVSRAIINAFFVDNESHQCSSDSLLFDLEFGTDANAIESEALYGAFEWVNANVEFASRCDAEDRAFAYFEKQIEAMFVKVRNDDISCEDATRILLCVASVLNLKFTTPYNNCTVIFDGLSKFTTAVELQDAVEQYGRVVSASIVRMYGFGHCRFGDAMAAERVHGAALNGTLLVDGVRPRAMSLSDGMSDGLPNQRNKRRRHHVDRREVDELSKVDISEHVETPAVPHLMGPMTEAFDEEGPVFNEVSPDNATMKHKTYSPTQVSSYTSSASTIGSTDNEQHAFETPESTGGQRY